MKIIQCQQGSDEWWEAKCGVPSASNFDRIITCVKGEPSTQAKAYIAELVAERVSQNPNYFSSRGVSRPMQNGVDTEPEARQAYAFLREEDVVQVGFCMTDDGRFGCSPDGLVGEDGALELKCPQLNTQVGYLIDATMPSEYKPQVHGQLIVTGRKWVDFFSYAPGLEPLLIRVTPDDYTEKLRKALDKFWIDYQKAVEKLLVHKPAF